MLGLITRRRIGRCKNRPGKSSKWSRKKGGLQTGSGWAGGEGGRRDPGFQHQQKWIGK